ncbi:MAG: hypothetical protein JWO46_3045 [Nocardioidaceae bacterium]|nr:hypothetical protein [Nocardioidaceae bacterium]
MSWTTFHRRGDVLRDVYDEADLRRDGTLPMQLPGVLGTSGTFRDELDLVGALALRWSTRLHAAIERELSDDADGEPGDLESAVRRAWIGTARELPGIRAILDRQLVSPDGPGVGEALQRARDKEHATLAYAAGRGTGPEAVGVGDRIERAARATYRPSIPMPSAPVPAPAPEVVSGPVQVPSGSAAFVARIKAVLAA